MSDSSGKSTPNRPILAIRIPDSPLAESSDPRKLGYFSIEPEDSDFNVSMYQRWWCGFHLPIVETTCLVPVVIAIVIGIGVCYGFHN